MDLKCPVCSKIFQVPKAVAPKRITCSWDCMKIYFKTNPRRREYKRTSSGHITKGGYRRIWVGQGHHLGGKSGHAAEHRIVAEKKIGRRLLPTEQVHHIDRNRLNNHEDNLLVFQNSAQHCFLHRKYDRGIRLPGEENVLIYCKCGCGKQLTQFHEKTGVRRELIYRHFLKGESVRRTIVEIISCGQTRLTEIIEKAKPAKVTYIKTLLSELVKTKKIQRVGRGMYKI